MKRIIALICSAVFVMCSFSNWSVVNAQVHDGDSVNAGAEELKKYGVMKGYPDGEMRVNSEITKAEAICMAFRMFGISSDDFEINDEKYVSLESHWSYKEVACADMNGLIDYTSESDFNPDVHVTYAEMTELIVNLLGYKEMAESTGGYPHGYVMVATNLGIYNNLDVSVEKKITRGNVAVMLKNSLDVPLMKISGFGAETSYVIMNGENGVAHETLRLILENK